MNTPDRRPHRPDQTGGTAFLPDGTSSRSLPPGAIDTSTFTNPYPP